MEKSLFANLRFGLLLTPLLGVLACGPSEPRLGKAREKEVVFETPYHFYVSRYTSPVGIDPFVHVFPKLQSTARPEELTLRLLAAFAQGKQEDYREILGPKERNPYDSELVLGNYPAKWQESMRGCRIELKEHFDFGTQQWIRYQLIEKASGQVRAEDQIGFQIEKGQWYPVEFEPDFFRQYGPFDESEKVVEKTTHGAG